MKTCPVCDKTFEDSMRFCQTDGTPLVDVPGEAPDPFKTMVAPKEDLDAAIPPPPEDPFKTRVAGAEAKGDSGDLLQLPEEEYDPMKTSVVSAGELPEVDGEKEASEAAPPSPFQESSAAPPSPFDDSREASISMPPEPPKFEEPSLSPPSFGDLSGEKASFTEGETEIIPPESLPKVDPFAAEPPKQDFTPPPAPSPFDETPSYQEPPPSYQEPEPPPTVMGSSPFDQPGGFGQQQFNQASQQGEWAPPPAPVANWQDQGLGANTPFQPPGATAGQDQTLAIVSLICGILGFCCGIIGIAGVITGFMAKNNAESNPERYGGRGLAIAGIILGAAGFLLNFIGGIIWTIAQR